ncbi:hypothetical protein P175DRAFT_0526213 [Aspergillus ochraceoroseus IBT 24754]|uniref:Uncharacterized protein n=1 Tax=Aspergillus ochraceoroseus IBT 24754 TaxID=1392256 RepID=A0A2T5LN05_9EURO|nr:uncharacterized protein P175DRAFT_0526213 [Aspergillus ochraceoroseus IBT 24754]PTU17656.1 hypothetical protein P175DRAFT_0526213 [Aspergillus ochraceoroseus IBT 24754]
MDSAIPMATSGNDPLKNGATTTLFGDNGPEPRCDTTSKLGHNQTTSIQDAASESARAGLEKQPAGPRIGDSSDHHPPPPPPPPGVLAVVAVCCEEGRHRSVAFVEELKRRLAGFRDGDGCYTWRMRVDVSHREPIREVQFKQNGFYETCKLPDLSRLDCYSYCAFLVPVE